MPTKPLRRAVSLTRRISSRQRMGEAPLRAELYGAEQLARHAMALARKHEISSERTRNNLLAQLDRNEQVLRDFNRATLAVEPQRRMTPAAEWLLDNFYLLEEQIQLARRHLPREYSRELPRLTNGSSPGALRVYDLVLELIAHVDAEIDADSVTSFVAAYQKVMPLKLGELWAIPIMLRLALIENLQRVTRGLTNARRDRNLANEWVEELQEVAEKNPSRLVIVVAEMAKDDPNLSSAFVAEFCHRLSRLNPVLHLARSWVEQRLGEQGFSIEQLIHQESQQQASDQVSVSHSIASLRALSSIDWKDFVEKLSLVEQTLRAEPAGVYTRMDFATRDRYRHAVETLARRSGLGETEIAQQAVSFAKESLEQNGRDDRRAHVGFYLIDNGRPALERAAKVRWPWRTLCDRGIRRFPFLFYGGGIFLFTLVATFLFVRQAEAVAAVDWRLIFCAVTFLWGVSQLAVGVLNWLTTLLVSPRLLPRLDYSRGIGRESRTMVVVPTILGSTSGIDVLLETLEIHHLANRDEHLHFALLTDFPDAAAEILPEDQALLQRTRNGITALNRKYNSGAADLFFLFHRPRQWNASEGVWMGYERKRGKLAEFNALLRGNGAQFFSEIVGDTSVLSKIKYVLTLDTDTQLPRESARQLAGTIAHPLNRPLFDPAREIVTEGYSLLQPRVDVSLPSANRSWFSRLHAGDAGIDPYTRAVSDVYQDLFQEGSFIGKGIYDVDAFERALRGRFPENSVLSHDLLESVYARCGLVSDVILYEDYPFRYDVDIGRRRRWMRGDWQIMPWLFPRVPLVDGTRARNPISGLSWWKIFDNLRRSLVPVALLLFLLGVLLLVPPLDLFGCGLAIAIFALPGLLPTAVDLLRKPEPLPWRTHLRSVTFAAGRALGQAALTLAFLPYEAFVSLEAIGRTLVRMAITRRKLLEWRTSSEVARRARTDLPGFYLKMRSAPVIALAGGIFLGLTRPAELAIASPLFVLWLIAPWIAWWISQPLAPRTTDLKAEQLIFLRRLFRKTWHFFETFVTAQENWLPPDNFQEDPPTGIAARTSPTNIGLALLANLAARDLGHLSLGNTLARTSATIATLLKLERHRGHFYNWYATRTLRPLLPLYVSTVDSGNLAGHLLTLGAGLRELAGEQIMRPEIFSGLRDTVGVLQSSGRESAALSELARKLAQTPATLREGHALLKQTAEIAGTLPNDAEGWTKILQQTCAEHLRELEELTPWASRRDLPASEVLAQLETSPSLREVALFQHTLRPKIEHDPALAPWLECLRAASARAREYLHTLEDLARQSEELAVMDFTFLFDEARELFAIGFNVSENRRDQSFYDLLASEARLCSYVAVAQGQVPLEHWFSLGRLLVTPRGEPILVSWSGSMFEYLMPMLVMPSYAGTLLDQACKAAVAEQIEYGRVRKTPWGISESGYNQTDGAQNYQYRAFGVPGLGLKRGLAQDLVIAPYATVMALMVAPREACENLQRLAADGREGAYGFYEAVDYTPARLPPNEKSATIRSFMAHHEGMSLLALLSVLRDRPMQRRFLSRPLLKAAELLLQERVPRTEANVLPEDLEMEETRPRFGRGENVMRVLRNPNARTPEVHLLSNGHYHLAISSAGGGYSRWRDLAVTRWREDATRDCWGTFLYLRDVTTGEFWSTAYQPALRAAESYEAVFTQARAEFRQRQSGIEIHTDICISPEDDVEVRRVRLTNHSSVTRVLDLTSYAEVVIAKQAADEAHPAFSNLSVQTEFIAASGAILCTRRARAEGEKPPWLFHLVAGQGGVQGTISCETDRRRFIGRGGTLENPAAMRQSFSNSAGPVLDPAISLRRSVILAPNETAVVDFVIGITEARETSLALVEKYQHARMADRVFDLAWTHSQVTLRQLNLTEAEAQLYARLAGAIIYADPARRAMPGVMLDNRRGQSGLWTYGISGDTPIVVLRVTDSEKIEMVRQMVQAHSYWRAKGLSVEMVILNEDVSVYRQDLQDQIKNLIASGNEAQMLDKPGGIFVRRLEQIPNDDRLLLQAAARIVLDDEHGSLVEQLEQRSVLEPLVPALVPSRQAWIDTSAPPPARDLIFQNGLGGFTRDGHEYVITLTAGQMTPAPWVNVLANPEFGTVVSETGGAYTWFENAHEFRLTPWLNEPVQNTTGEALYIRDEETGQVWSPTPWPARGATPYVVRHGFGYTVFEHFENGIVSELWVYVALDAPVKLSVLKLRNASGGPRRLSVTGYWEWVLGDLRPKTLLNVQTEVDLKTGALLARNFYNTEFPDRIVFLDVNDPNRTLTGNRKEFLGRNGTFERPAALKRERLAGKTGAGLDPCGAIQVAFDLADGETRETTFRLGVGRSAAEVQQLIQRFRRAEASQSTRDAVHEFWNRTLGAVNVDTPDPSVNVMANGWLLYQTIGCRLWGRTGFYQSGGAYGFRDQLQDVMALVHAEPRLTREHLLRAASHQFREGDVQHWWHPPAGRGVRTHFSDDYLWLPYVTCRYVNAVADTGVLDETISFLEARPVMPEEEAYYDLPNRSQESGTLYEHCVRAIKHGLKFGEHGLPLMGCGDWNDGMNLVGDKGRGESVWLAFFLYDVLQQFALLARAREDEAFAEQCLAEAQKLQKNIEAQAWDGEWYRRAYFDDGAPLGSHTNPECQIDSLPQSWSVISGAGDPARARQAMDAVDKRLVRRGEKLVQLFDPPFDKSALNPGYIKGYIPGVRENGGQYTHGAIWTTMAFALLGETERAWEIFHLLNPVHHSETPAQIATYKVEPYVAAADVYAVAPHIGRGGWTWYTGSAGWMYRLLVETLLGAHLEKNQLRLEPRFPAGWTSYKIHYRYRQTVYHITLSRVGDGAIESTLDGQPLTGNILPLTDDRIEHFVEMRFA
ncbi:MAG: cyclic beta 1-2 glucan synthetase [Chthoniobacterales bacterium]|nr:cyclic beta 1-2 glucan synthetase [Chthoniobacterales bacterium]